MLGLRINRLLCFRNNLTAIAFWVTDLGGASNLALSQCLYISCFQECSGMGSGINEKLSPFQLHSCMGRKSRMEQVADTIILQTHATPPLTASLSISCRHGTLRITVRYCSVFYIFICPRPHARFFLMNDLNQLDHFHFSILRSFTILFRVRIFVSPNAFSIFLFLLCITSLTILIVVIRLVRPEYIAEDPLEGFHGCS